MALPSFHPVGPPPSNRTSRFSFIHIQEGVRSLLNGSSIYSRSPNPSHGNTPKLSFGFSRRSPSNSPDQSIYRHSGDNFFLNNPYNYQSRPLEPQSAAASYQWDIYNTDAATAPEEPETVYVREPLGQTEPELEHRVDGIHHERRRRRRRHRRRHRRQQGWVRKQNDRGGCVTFARSRPAKSKCMSLLISGLFLLAILTIYLSIALSRPNVGQEVHILFILVILCTTIFFCHALVRLCMIALRSQPDSRPHIPEMTGLEGFKPVRPIRVHLARDEEEAEVEEDPIEKDSPILKPPPPAYGLWRSSVRADPNLLHWHRITPTTNGPSHPQFDLDQQPDGAGNETRRPPSYISDDGISYVVDAAPRSTIPSSGTSDVHPAYRPPLV